MKMRRRLERFGEVEIADKANAFGLDFVKKTETIFQATSSGMGAVL